MVNFIRKRLQVFVSSTYSDLIKERQAAVEAILTAGHIPAGMELFTSGDQSQMEVINQWIDESDVYLLILGGRYGSIEPTTGKSYTQLEYEYALNRGKSLFACVITEPALENRVRENGSSVIETIEPQKLKEFRSLVLTKVVKFWEDSKDIKIAIGETLAQFSRKDDLVGWVRASQQANMPALADEIARLSRENALLRSQVEQGKSAETYKGLTFAELLAVLESKDLLEFLNKKRTSFGSTYGVSSSTPAEEEKLRELCVLGILQSHDRAYGSYSLTSTGQAFLNRLVIKRSD